jgi:two-component system OmpR family response regulator
MSLSTPLRALLIEDDADFAAELGDYLRRHGLTPVVFPDTERFEAFIERGEITPSDLILLDLGLGDEDGLDFLRHRLRALGVPCIVLTGNDDATDRVVALELGADDYIVKTTPPREIVARIRAVMRRVAKKGDARGAAPDGGAWVLDPMQRDLLNPDGQRARLTAAEYDLLARLVQRQNEPVGRDELSRVVLDRPYSSVDRAIDNLIARLRKKIAHHGREIDVIKSVRQRGYVFTGFPR